MTPSTTLTDAAEPAVRRAILGPLVRFNAERSGQPENHRPLVIAISHPQTGEAIKIPARKKVRFSVAKTFKESVLGGKK